MSVPRVEVPQFKKMWDVKKKKQNWEVTHYRDRGIWEKSDDICLTCALGELIVKNYWENVDRYYYYLNIFHFLLEIKLTYSTV